MANVGVYNDNAFGQGLANAGQLFQDQMLHAQVPYAQQVAQANMQQQQAQAGILGSKAQYAPQMDAAALQNQQNINQWYAPNQQANIGLEGAQANNLNVQAKYTPLKILTEAQTAAQTGSRFGGAYQLAKSLQAMAPAARDTWISQNQDQYNQMLTDLGNKQNVNYITPQLMNKYYPGMGINSDPSASAPVAPAASGMAAQPPVNAGVDISNAMQTPSLSNAPQPMQAGGMAAPNSLGAPPIQNAPVTASASPIGGIAAPLPSTVPNGARFSSSTPDQINQVQLANQMSANKELTTNATRRQAEGAIQVENIINDPNVQDQVQDAANYAGAIRKGGAAIDALSQTNPKAYENYLAFTTQTAVLLQNRIKTLDQMGATDKQREELQGLLDSAMNSLTSNPGQFVTQFNKLGSTLNTISQAVQASASPIAPVNRLNGFNPIAQGGTSSASGNPGNITKTINGQQYTKIKGQWYAQ